MSKILSHEQLISATPDRKGIAEIATINEIKEGISNDTFISPSLLNTASIISTTEAMTIYVNSGDAFNDTALGNNFGAGSDSTGDGSITNPYATIVHAISKCPKALKHNIEVIPFGIPHYADILVDGTNGIRFTTGDTGVVVDITTSSNSTTTFNVTVDKAITIVLKSGGDTLNNINTLIKNTNTVNSIIFPILIGSSVTITSAFSAVTLTNGAVRNYSECITISGFKNYGGSLMLSGYYCSNIISNNSCNYGIRMIADYSSNLSDNIPISISYCDAIWVYRIYIKDLNNVGYIGSYFTLNIMTYFRCCFIGNFTGSGIYSNRNKTYIDYSIFSNNNIILSATDSQISILNNYGLNTYIHNYNSIIFENNNSIAETRTISGAGIYLPFLNNSTAITGTDTVHPVNAANVKAMIDELCASKQDSIVNALIFG